jgi:PAS domain S-box-containing protein
MSILPPDAALRLAAIVQSSDDAIVSKDLDGIITSWNAGAERMFGYAAADAVGQSIRLIIPADRPSEEADVLAAVRAGHVVEPFDTVRLHKDGTPVDVSVAVSPIHDGAGRIIGASTIVRNISERKRIERQVRSLQSRLMRLAMASASILVSPDVDSVLSSSIELARDVFDADGYAVWRLEGGEWKIVRSFGISEEFRQRVLGSGTAAGAMLRLTEPLVCERIDAVASLADLHDAYARAGIAAMIVYPLIVREQRRGTLVFYSRLPRKYPDDDVRVGRAIANLMAASLTTAELYDEQRIAREEAEHSRMQSAFLADAGTALSASLDYEATLAVVARLAVPTIADWCTVDIVNDHGATQRLAVAHIDPAKVELARAIEERYPADPAAPGGVHEVIRTGKPVLMERIPKRLLETAARDDDHRRLIEQLSLTSYMCVPLMAQGKAFGAISFASAESGRHYAESDLAFARELATRASLAVENARAYARANNANRVKDEFLATLSHELRTPLNAVLGYARMLRLGTVTPERAKNAVEVVERNATALKQIIEDVLDVSRIVAGRLRLNVEPLDLPQILQEAAETLMPAAAAKGVSLVTMIDPMTTPVSGDADRLLQIVWNLLSNAIKFTTRGGKVQLRLSRVNSHAEISVSDTGRGIPPDFLPFVFEHFRQADASFSREHGGLGLGLGIAKQLTELHGGTITAASDGVNRGATFVVTLPLMIVHGAASLAKREQPAADRHPGAVDPVPRLDGINVLAVDDEPDSVNLLRTVLEGAGAKVTSAESGSAALESLQTTMPDVMIADIGMPGMDGVQLIRAIRRMDEPVRSLPAAALTAYARSQDRITSLASGFQMHLVKPIDPLELIVAVSTLAPRKLRG